MKNIENLECLIKFNHEAHTKLRECLEKSSDFERLLKDEGVLNHQLVDELDRLSEEGRTAVRKLKHLHLPVALKVQVLQSNIDAWEKRTTPIVQEKIKEEEYRSLYPVAEAYVREVSKAA